MRAARTPDARMMPTFIGQGRGTCSHDLSGMVPGGAWTSAAAPHAADVAEHLLGSAARLAFVLTRDHRGDDPPATARGYRCSFSVYVYEFVAAHGMGPGPGGREDPADNSWVYVYEFVAACGVGGRRGLAGGGALAVGRGG